MINDSKKASTAYYHLPGLFEFYEFYKLVLPLYERHREYFYDWCEIGSLYGAPEDCIWGGGRVGGGEADEAEVLEFVGRLGISPRLTFSNSLLTEEHLNDKRCGDLCSMLAGFSAAPAGIIVHSELLLNHLKENYPGLYLVSSTTKVQTDIEEFMEEVRRDDFTYVVPDFRLNKELERLDTLTQSEKDKVEFLCNECCNFSCIDRRECYEAVSRRNLNIDAPEHICKDPDSDKGYSFARAMKNPGFISLNDIKNIYMPMGFSNFKIEGRGLGTAMVLEFILYYMVKPEYVLDVREAVYLDSMLDII